MSFNPCTNNSWPVCMWPPFRTSFTCFGFSSGKFASLPNDRFCLKPIFHFASIHSAADFVQPIGEFPNLGIVCFSYIRIADLPERRVLYWNCRWRIGLVHTQVTCLRVKSWFIGG